jgi:hypothetical protein
MGGTSLSPPAAYLALCSPAVAALVFVLALRLPFKEVLGKEVGEKEKEKEKEKEGGKDTAKEATEEEAADGGGKKSLQKPPLLPSSSDAETQSFSFPFFPLSSPDAGDENSGKGEEMELTSAADGVSQSASATTTTTTTAASINIAEAYSGEAGDDIHLGKMAGANQKTLIAVGTDGADSGGAADLPGAVQDSDAAN